jgi:hypothetical protein
MEDLVRSYDLAGIQWGAERQGPLMNVVSPWDSRPPTCFCEFCVARGRKHGIDPERAGDSARSGSSRRGRPRRTPTYQADRLPRGARPAHPRLVPATVPADLSRRGLAGDVARAVLRPVRLRQDEGADARRAGAEGVLPGLRVPGGAPQRGERERQDEGLRRRRVRRAREPARRVGDGLPGHAQGVRGGGERLRVHLRHARLSGRHPERRAAPAAAPPARAARA